METTNGAHFIKMFELIIQSLNTNMCYCRMETKDKKSHNLAHASTLVTCLFLVRCNKSLWSFGQLEADQKHSSMHIRLLFLL